MIARRRGLSWRVGHPDDGRRVSASSTFRTGGNLARYLGAKGALYVTPAYETDNRSTG